LEEKENLYSCAAEYFQLGDQTIYMSLQKQNLIAEQFDFERTHNWECFNYLSTPFILKK
jgi:hypothetical protein